MSRAHRSSVLAVIATAALALGLLFLTTSPARSAPTPQAVWTLKLSQRATLAEFMQYRANPPVAGLSWSTDGCSGPALHAGLLAEVGSRIATYLIRQIASAAGFKDACIRHDFCYRNNPVHRPVAWAADYRRTCDGVFDFDMKFQCYVTGGAQICYDAANAFYNAVRRFG